METIRNTGKSSLLAGFADRVEGKSAPVKDSKEGNMALATAIGWEPVTENTVGRMIVKCNKDFVLLNESVEGIEVKNGVCNDAAFEEWEMSEYVRLRELIVGDECFQFVKDVRIV